MRGSAYDWDPDAPEDENQRCDGCGEPIIIVVDPCVYVYDPETLYTSVYHAECEPSD